MHDPMSVAFDVPSPILHRKRWSEAHYDGRRWGFTRRRRTNAENLGEPVYRWWRPAGWTFALGGRVYGLGKLATVWHVEPGGRDSGEVCKHYRRSETVTWRTRLSPFLRIIPPNRPDQKPWIADLGWKWHVHHWHIQIQFFGRLGRFLWERCIECGRRYPWGYAPVSHQWDEPKGRRFRVRRRAYHHECSGLVHSRHSIATREAIIRHLFAAYRLEVDADDQTALAHLTDPKSRGMEFRESYDLTRILGFERDDDYRLVRAARTERSK